MNDELKAETERLFNEAESPIGLLDNDPAEIWNHIAALQAEVDRLQECVDTLEIASKNVILKMKELRKMGKIEAAIFAPLKAYTKTLESKTKAAMEDED